MSAETENIWCVVPASGVGTRMGADRPKQYLKLNGKMVLDWTLEVLIGLSEVKGIMVGVAESDEWWPSLSHSRHKKIFTAGGGSARIQTVINGLSGLRQHWSAGDYDWVLVHDAVRPCVLSADIKTLIKACKASNNGGLLGTVLVDTIKRVSEQGVVLQTEARNDLWRAMTPQMFRLGELESALCNAVSSGIFPTDESAAMELRGYQPKMIPGSPLNIKITLNSDIKLAESILET
ncbi:MAG: 2-C-methyl-D-erythritol 4-phosphate cytidylyltransferase [bacterium]